jgi:WS/DGAT/MGAT family acyltransferase
MLAAVAQVFHEPLSAMDRQFLEIESPAAPMHVFGVSAYEAAPLRGETGGLDFGRLRKAIEATLPRIPRYRHKLAWTPLERRPVWVDDASFELDYHVHHACLPPPGGEEQLKRLMEWIVERPLDRTRPLWEMWFVEGLDGGAQFAVITKMHHCMLDGGAGVNLMALLLRPDADPGAHVPAPWTPRPASGALALGLGEVARRASTPLRALRGALRFGREHPDLAAALAERVAAVGALLANALPGSATPLNGTLGAHRRLDWLELPLAEMNALRSALGCSLNDLVLAAVTGGLRRLLRRRKVALEHLDFRVSVPVDVRREEERRGMGNRVSSWIVRLPLAVADPLDRVAAIAERTRALKATHQAVAIEMLMAAAEEVPLLFSLATRAQRGQVHSIVTNVPGPPIPLYLLGCRARTMQPFVPLFPGMGLTVAVLSYDGRLFWGFLGDPDRVPEIAAFRGDVEDALAELRAAAGRRS